MMIPSNGCKSMERSFTLISQSNFCDYAMPKDNFQFKIRIEKVQRWGAQGKNAPQRLQRKFDCEGRKDGAGARVKKIQDTAPPALGINAPECR